MIVKTSVSILASLAIAVALTGCEFGVFDNYDAPKSILTGHVVYQGEAIGVRSNGVQLELWQPGFDLNEKIPSYVAEDGSFSASLFDGDYKLNLLPGNGPWTDTRDTIQIHLSGRAEVDVPVVPYYTIADPVMSETGGAIEATFGVHTVDDTRTVEYVGLYVSTTSFVDRTNMDVRVEVPRASIASLDVPLTLRVDLPANLVQRGDVFARIGIKTMGVAELLFSPVQRVTF